MFPTTLYHREYGAKAVNSQEEMDSLGEGWADNPGKVGLIPYVLHGHMHFEKAQAETYREHMSEWESKEEKKKPGRHKKEKA